MNKKRLAAFGIALTGTMLVASIAFTVAWYNGSSNLAIYNFDISLANKKLTISTDNVNFKENLTREDVKDAIPEKYRPVSSAFSNEWISQKATAPQFTSGYNYIPEKVNMTSFYDVNNTDDGVFRKVLYLKSDSYAKISLDAEKTYINADKEANESISGKLKKIYPNLTKEQIAEQLNKIENSLRFSILVLNDDGEDVKEDEYQYTIVDPHKNGTTKLGGILDADGDGYYDNVNGKEVIYGEVKNANDGTISYKNAEANDVGESENCFDSKHKAGVQTLDFESSKSKGMEIVEEHSLSLEELSQFTFTLQADVSKKIVLSQYIEGWDTDSVNYTMFSRFVTSICFKLADGGNGGN